MDIMKHVDILDLIRIHVIPETFYGRHTGKFQVLLESTDPQRQVVIDESEAKAMNESIAEKASQFEARDPRAVKYIEEFVARLISELYRNGLVLLEELPDGPVDHYQNAKNEIFNQIKALNKR